MPSTPSTPNGAQNQINGTSGPNGLVTSSGALGNPYPATPVNITNIQNSTPSGPGIGNETFATPSGSARPNPPAHVSSRSGIPKAEIKSTANSGLNSTPASAQSNTTTLAAQISHTVEEQLSVAKAEILKLQKQMSEGNLNLGEKARAAAVDVKQRTEQIEGYQLTVVLAVAVAAFSVGYLYHSWG